MNTKLRQTHPAEAGVSLIEMMIAILVLTVGLVSLAQLFTVALLNNRLAVTTSGGVNDAQRLIEAWKTEAATSVDGISSTVIRSAVYNESTHACPAFAALPGYSSIPSDFEESVWVFDWNGNVVGTASPAMPPGITPGTLKATAEKSRLVYIRLEPKVPDPRANDTVALTAIITGK